MIEVLWIDDQYKEEAMIQLIIAAENRGIKLNGYASYEQAFEVLEKDLERFDCILLDGMFFKKKDQEKGTEDETGIGAAINHMNRLSGKKEFPWFVLSGKDKFTSGENDFLKANEAQCFDKSNPEDVERLFIEIKKDCESIGTFQIRKKYDDVLEVSQDDFLGQAQFPRIFTILSCIEKSESIAGHFNGIRMVLECMFERLGNAGLVPDALVKDGSLNRMSLFLSDRHSNYKHKEVFIHPLFAENVYRLLNVIQDGSHDNGGLNLKVQDYIRTNSSVYFQRSVAFLFIDVLIGFKTLKQSHSDREENLKLWQSTDNPGDSLLEGEITEQTHNGFKFIDSETEENLFFPNHIVSDEILSNLKVGTEIFYRIKSESEGKKFIDGIVIK